jgi:glycosyltransferase involved in cell wall biosynthesis
MPKVLLIENYLPDQQLSMLRYGDVLKKELEKIGYNFVSLRPTSLFGRLPSPQKLKKWLRYIDKYILFPIRLKFTSHSFDLVHILDHSNGVYVNSFRKNKVIITCHDLLAIRAALGEIPQQEISKTGKILQKWIRKSLSKIPYVISVSAASQKDLDRICPPMNGYVRKVISTGVLLSDHEPRNLSSDTQPFLLHVGGNQWYKNRSYVVDLFSNLKTTEPFRNHKLFLVGKPPSPSLLQSIDNSDQADAIECLTDVSDEELIRYYRQAEALLFPSLYEGFGLPIIESQSHKTWVITTQKDPMMDIAGEGATLVSPKDSENACSTILEEYSKKDELIKAGTRNLERFSMPLMIKNITKFYEEVASI